MDNLKVSMLKKVQTHLLTWLLPTIGTVALGIVLLLEQHLAKLIPQPTEIWAVRAIAISLLLLCLVAVSYFRYRPKFKPLSWGVHQDIKSGTYYCSACLIQNKIHSPMFLSSDSRRWVCHSKSQSNHYVQNPNSKEPEPPPSPSRNSTSWMGS